VARCLTAVFDAPCALQIPGQRLDSGVIVSLFQRPVRGFCRIKRFLSKNGVDFIEQFLLGIA